MLKDWYAHFDPIAFSFFGIQVHWYGLAYVTALLGAFFMASRFKKSPPFTSISDKNLELFFIYIELGTILGARLGYVLVYSPDCWEYLLKPWQIFNPFDAYGNFIGISGMSYHGGMVGFLLGAYLFAKKYKQNLWLYLDLIALSIPLAYVFGRIGNFLNHELYGRIIPESDTFWTYFGVYVDGALRYPSQLIEAFLEGIIVFIIIWIARRYIRFQGGLIAVYAISYALMRFIAEFYRQPDIQLGFYGIFSMGQILSFAMFAGGIWIGIMRYRQIHNCEPLKSLKKK